MYWDTLYTYGRDYLIGLEVMTFIDCLNYCDVYDMGLACIENSN